MKKITFIQEKYTRIKKTIRKKADFITSIFSQVLTQYNLILKLTNTFYWYK